MSHATDEELMERVVRGDVAAFEALYDRHSGRAMRVARALTGDGELAAEAVQEAFLSVWRNSRHYSPSKGSFRSWAMTVVRNRTIDLIRTQATGPIRVSIDDDLIGELADRRPGTPETAALLADVHQVRNRLDELPGAQREAIVLAYYGGLSHSEIAAQLSLPLGTVKGRMRIALQTLRGTLGSELARAS